MGPLLSGIDDIFPSMSLRYHKWKYEEVSLFSCISGFYSLCLPEGSMVEWSQMTFNLAQLAARPGIILKTERSSLWPQIQNYSTFSSTLCCATPVHRCPSGCWAYQGEPELRHSNWSAVPGNLSVLMAGHLHCTGRFAVLVELL